MRGELPQGGNERVHLERETFTNSDVQKKLRTRDYLKHYFRVTTQTPPPTTNQIGDGRTTRERTNKATPHAISAATK